MKQYLLLLLLMPFTIVNAKNFYFSTSSGVDSRTPTQAQNPATPWKTIDKLNNYFSSLSPKDTVLFKRNETFYGSLTISRSGDSLKPIVLGAYGTGARPIITGFTSLSGWNATGGGIFEQDCPTCLPTLNMVSINDTLQPIGRYPKVDDPNGGYWSVLSHNGNSIESYDLLGTTNFVGSEIVMRKYQWIMDRAIITSQGQYSLTYTPLTSPNHPGFTYDAVDGNGFFIQNHTSTFSKPGDWSYDKNTKKFKVYLLGNGKVKVSTVEHLVNMYAISYVTFDNLAFQGANGNTFDMDTCNNIIIKNCSINFSGKDGIFVSLYNSHHNTVDNCTFSNTNNNAVSGTDSPTWMITNNTIRNTGKIAGMGQSGDGQYIAISHVGTKSLVQNNKIINTGYNAIFFGGDSVTIRNNLIDSFCLVKTDGGGIYTYYETLKRGRKITGNIVMNGIGDKRGLNINQNSPFYNEVHGIYIDAGATDVEIDSNTIANCSHAGIWLGSTTEAKVRNNTSFNNAVAQIKLSDASRGQFRNLVVKNNILFAKDPTYQLVSSIVISYNYLQALGIIDSNFYCRPLMEPSGVMTSGYSKAPSNETYHDGGIIEGGVGWGSYFYSLDKWKIFSGQDSHSKITQVANVDKNSIRFEYNASYINKRVTLDGVYKDVKNNSYRNSVTLLPYTSIILMKSLPAKNISSRFQVVKSGKIVDLKWNLNEERQVSKFEVQRAADNINFNSIDTVYTNLSSLDIFNYQDKNPLEGTNYYRIKSIFYDRTYSINKAEKVFFEGKVDFNFSPNPVTNQINVTILKRENLSNSVITIKTLDGKTLKTIHIPQTGNFITINTADLPTATYLITLTNKSITISKKLIKIR